MLQNGFGKLHIRRLRRLPKPELLKATHGVIPLWTIANPSLHGLHSPLSIKFLFIQFLSCQYLIVTHSSSQYFQYLNFWSFPIGVWIVCSLLDRRVKRRLHSGAHVSLSPNVYLSTNKGQVCKCMQFWYFFGWIYSASMHLPCIDIQWYAWMQD